MPRDYYEDLKKINPNLQPSDKMPINAINEQLADIFGKNIDDKTYEDIRQRLKSGVTNGEKFISPKQFRKQTSSDPEKWIKKVSKLVRAAKKDLAPVKEQKFPEIEVIILGEETTEKTTKSAKIEKSTSPIQDKIKQVAETLPENDRLRKIFTDKFARETSIPQTILSKYATSISKLISTSYDQRKQYIDKYGIDMFNDAIETALSKKLASINKTSINQAIDDNISKKEQSDMPAETNLIGVLF